MNRIPLRGGDFVRANRFNEIVENEKASHILVASADPLSGSFAFAEEEYKFDLSEIEKKPYHVGGYVEFRPVLFGLDRDAALYKLKFYNRDEGKTIEEYNGKLQLKEVSKKGLPVFSSGPISICNTPISAGTTMSPRV